MEEKKLRISIRRVLLVALCGLSVSAYCNDENDEFIQQLVTKAQHGEGMSSIAGLQSAPSQERAQTSGALYFVSFSIPDDGIKEMMNDADHYGIPLLINGLVADNFRSTMKKIFSLKRDNNVGGVQIDPVSFRKYGITKVPALLVMCGTSSDVVYGNVKIRNALEEITRNGDCKEKAKSILGAHES